MDYRLVDVDQHYYEPDDCFTRHLESTYSDRSLHIRRERDDGLGEVWLGDGRLGFFSITACDHVGPPGAMRAYFKGEADSFSSSLEGVDARGVPEYMDRSARLARLESQNTEAAVMLPTLGVGIEHEFRHDPPAWYANMRAFNRWLEEDWGYGGDGRLFGIPMMSLVDVDEATAEVDRALAAGARMFVLRPGPIYGRSPADSHFDPFWARVNEARVPVAFHIGNSGYAELFSAQWGEAPNPPHHRYSAFQLMTGMGERPMFDTMASLALSDLFERFADLRIVSIELGGGWVPNLVKRVGGAARSAFADWPNGKPEADPSDLIRRHLYVAPYPEDPFAEIVEVMGTDHVLLGSDWPHPEGLVQPGDLFDELGDLDDAVVRAIMRDNTAELLGIPAVA